MWGSYILFGESIDDIITMDYERTREGETIRKRGVTIKYVQKEANFRMITSFTYTPTQNNTKVFCIGGALTHNGAATIGKGISTIYILGSSE